MGYKYKISKRNGVSVGNNIKVFTILLITIFIAGALLQSFIDSIEYTESPFYTGLTILGFEVGGYPANADGNGYYPTCSKTTPTADLNLAENQVFSSGESTIDDKFCYQVTNITQ